MARRSAPRCFFRSPLDPHVPDENPTSDYCFRFECPAHWWYSKRILLRFHGVESTYPVRLNGPEVGFGTGSRLVQEFAVTASVDLGENVLVARVYQWSAACSWLTNPRRPNRLAL